MSGKDWFLTKISHSLVTIYDDLYMTMIYDIHSKWSGVVQGGSSQLSFIAKVGLVKGFLEFSLVVEELRWLCLK